MVVVAKGYRVVPQRLPPESSSQGFRHLHLKEHRRVFKTTTDSTAATKSSREATVFAIGQTLYVGNVDDQGGRLCAEVIENRLRRALSSCGDIVHVHASSTIAAGKKANAKDASRFAHVCFASTEGVQRALSLAEVPSGALQGDEVAATGEKQATEETKIDRKKHGAKSPDAESRDEHGDQTCGFSAFIQRHHRQFPPRKALQEEVDSSMRRFESAEAEELAKRKEMRDNPVDDDGFQLVTYKRKRGRNGDGDGDGENHEGGRRAGAGGSAKKKRKGSDKLSDFYRFQMRETRREQLAALRSKFEQDKARVAKMKEQRKFRPF